MIRRPSRTALHSALSALSGGLRGVAMQRQQEEERIQTGLRNEREALRDALSLADIGATEAPETFAPGAPVPQTVPFGGKRYVVPTLAERQERASRAEAERARVAAEAKAKVEEAQREAANLRAFGAAQLAVPEMVPPTAQYNPMVEYEKLISPSAQRVASTDTARETALRANRLKARAWFNSVYGDTDVSQATRNRIGQVYTEMSSRMPPNTDPDDLLVGLMAGYEAQVRTEKMEAERLRAEAAARRGGRGDRPPPPGVSAVQPDAAAARPSAPATAPGTARPAVTPAAPVTAPASAPAVSPGTAPRTQWRPADYDAALDALGPDAGDAEVNAWLVQNRPLTRVP